MLACEWQVVQSTWAVSVGTTWQHQSVPDLPRSEEHTSELQSPCNLVCRLLLEKKTNERPQVLIGVLPPPSKLARRRLVPSIHVLPSCPALRSPDTYRTDVRVISDFPSTSRATIM